MEKKSSLKFFCDGGARGNPGPAACAFLAVYDNKVIYKNSRYLGIATNNVAEYSGVVLAFDWLTTNPNRNFLTVDFFLDSELVVRQLTGIYKVKNENLKKLTLKIKSFEKKFPGKINYYSVPRSKNEDADFLVNKALDENL